MSSAADWRLRERAVLHGQVHRAALALRDARDLCDRTRWAAGALLVGEARGLDATRELAELRDAVREVESRVRRIEEACGG